MGKYGKAVDNFEIGSWYEFQVKGSSKIQVGKCVGVKERGCLQLEFVKLAVGTRIKTKGKDRAVVSKEDIVITLKEADLKWASWEYAKRVKTVILKLGRNQYEEVYQTELVNI